MQETGNTIYLSEHMPAWSAVLCIGPRGTIDHANDHALELLKRPVEEVVGSFYGRYLRLDQNAPDHAGDRGHCDPVIRCLATEEMCPDVVGLLRISQSDTRAFAGVVAPTYNAEREVAGAVLMLACESA